MTGLSRGFPIIPETVGRYVSIPFAPVQKIVTLGANKVANTITFFKDIQAVRQENEGLKKQVDGLEKENRDLKEFRQENKDLRKALNIKDQFASFEPIGANIIAKNAGNWFDTFVIDRGNKDKIAKDMPVITSDGLVGRISEPNSISSKVEALIDKNTVISARISQKGDLVRVKGDMQYSDKGLCVMDRIPPEADIVVGDIVETSGIGGIYPRGILIGKIIEIRKSDDAINKYAIIQPAVDFRRLDEVIILKSNSGG
jgi:rod shape-determining protein MreC